MERIRSRKGVRWYSLGCGSGGGGGCRCADYRLPANWQPEMLSSGVPKFYNIMLFPVISLNHNVFYIFCCFFCFLPNLMILLKFSQLSTMCVFHIFSSFLILHIKSFCHFEDIVNQNVVCHFILLRWFSSNKLNEIKNTGREIYQIFMTKCLFYRIPQQSCNFKTPLILIPQENIFFMIIFTLAFLSETHAHIFIMWNIFSHLASEGPRRQRPRVHHLPGRPCGVQQAGGRPRHPRRPVIAGCVFLG